MGDSKVLCHSYVDLSCQRDGLSSLSPAPVVQSGVAPFTKSRVIKLAPL